MSSSVSAATPGRVSTFDTYTFKDENGKALFEHVRMSTNDERGKTFYYRWRDHPKALWVNKKPTARTAGFDADHYLYRLPEVLAAVRAGEPVWWAEGERDALALRNAGVCGTSHHGGAGKVHIEQCAWLADAAKVVLCLDKDSPGAYDGLLRYRTLTEAIGVDPARIRVVFSKAKHCKDVRDHLALGHPLTALRGMSIAGLRKEASKYTQETASRAGYIYVRSPKEGRQ